ncbi:hypothetical protein [Maribacter sp. HTCC2170]|uniref:hypothetical protein n=1 Tax=Maribacter sp. (strain HTCC2170 / KCCM 42371) TaxID=313603 RepID=UPI0005A1E7E2|nr:hypothetical protein [Maribacter sp. HTCC2170]
MNRKILILIFLLFSGFAFAQTTVNLEDQCNCEVLSGTDVTAPGMVTPAGADTGDVYVNTNTGTIYFWDGDSWELTSSDNQQLQNFSFDSGTNMLSLDIENGNSVSVNLTDLADQDATEVNLNGPIDVDGDGNDETTVQEAIADLAAITETVTNLVDNNDGTITYTNEDGTPQTINKSDLTDNLDGTFTFDNGDGAPITFVGTDDQDATEVNLNGPIDVDGDGNDETTVQEAIADLAAITETVTNLVDNNDGTITYTNEDGTPQTINKSDLTDNLDGTFTFDNGDGAPITFVGTDDQDATEVNLNGPIDVDGDGNDETTVQDAIADLAAIAETVTNLVDNNDGTITYTNEDGTPQTINKSDLTDNGDGTFTFDNGDGAPITFVGTDDQDATEVNLNGPIDVDGDGNDETTVQDAIADLAAIAETVTNLVDNNDGTITYTNEDGTPQTINKSDLTDNGDGTFTFDNGDGAPITFVGTDDQDATEVNLNGPIDVDGDGNDETTVQDAIADLAAIAETVTNLVDNNDGTITYTNEDGTPQTINKSDLTDNGDGTFTFDNGDGAPITFVGTDDQDATEVNLNGPIDVDGDGNDETTVQDAIADLAAIAETVTNLVDNNDGTITYTNEDGTPQTINKSDLTDNGDGTFTFDNGDGAPITFVGTDDQDATEVNLNGPIDVDGDGNDETTVQDAIADLAAIAETVTNLVDNNDGTITYTNEDGTPQTINKSDLTDNGDGTFTFDNGDGAPITFVGTDDQDATEVNLNGPIDVDGDGNDETTVQDAIADLAAIAETVTNLVDNNDGTITYTNEDGTPQTINKSDLTDNGDGTFTFDNGDGAPIAFVGTDDQTIDGLSIVDGELNISLEDDAVAPATVDMISGDLNNDIGFGTDGALYLNVASVTISETITNLVDNNNGTITYTNENGTPQTVNKADISDNGDGTYTFDNGNGSPITFVGTDTDDQIANEVNITDAGGNFTATEVEGALAELAAGSTDDQALSLAGNTLTLEDGGTVDLSGYLDDTDTDDQTLSLAGNTLTLEDGGTVDLSGYLDDTDTDDQTLSLAGNTLSIADGNSVDLSGYVSTDDQALSLAGNTLTLEDGGTVDLSGYVSTDDQALSLAGNTLTLEDGGTVDLSGYVSTDDQIANEVNITDAGGNFTATEVEGALAELAAGSTDDQALSLAGNTLTLEDGGTVDLSGYVSTDDQALSLAGNTLTLEDGGTVDLSGYVSTDDQIANEVNITDAGGNFTATEVEGALAELAAGSTDDQQLNDTNTVFNSGTNTLTIELEDGGTATADFSALDNDDQDISTNGTAGNISIDDGSSITLNVDDADAVIGNEVTNGTDATLTRSGAGTTGDPYTLDVAADGITNAEIADNAVQLENIADGTADGQVMQWDNATSSWTLVDLGSVTVTENDGVIGNEVTNATDGTLTRSGAGTTVSPYTLGVSANGITNTELANNAVGLENIADGSSADQIMQWDGSDWILVDGAGLSTDDQALSLAGNTLTLEDGGTVDLSGYLDDTDTDDQTLSLAGNTLSIADGNSVDLSGYVSTDDQALSLAGNTLTLEDGGTVDLSGYVSTDDQIANEVNITDAGGNFTATEVEGALAELAAGSTDDQALSLAGNTLTLEDGGTVDLSGYLDDTDTDDQTLSLSGNTLSIADGNSVDLSGYVSTDDQIANEVNITDAGGNFTATEVEGALAELAAGSTDDQALSLAGNTLTLEDGGTVDLSGYVSTDDQALSLAGNTLTLEDGGTVDLSGYVSTDDQALSLAGNTLTLEDGGTVDLSGYVSTDDQIANEVNITDAGGNFTATEVEGALAELAAGSTDDQALSLAGNTLTLEDGGTVDLSGYVSTDDQIANEVNITDAGGNFTATEVEGALAELAAGSTDDQQLNDTNTVFNSGTNTLTIELEDGGTATADFSALDNDDQDISTNGTAGNISIDDGSSITLNVNDADAVIGNEVTNGTDATLTRSGAGTTGDPYTLDVAADGITNAEIADNAVQLENIADGTADGQVMQWDNATSSWTLVDLGSVTVTENDGVIGNEVTNATDGTLTRSGAGTTVSPYTLGVSANGITNTELANNAVGLENIADGSSADQIMQWDGSDWILVDGAGLSTDDQALSLAGNTLTLEDGGTVDLSGYLDDTDTDDQTLSLAGNTLSIADGNSVDLSGYVSTDDQALSLAGNTLTLEDGGTVDLSGYVSTDDQIANEVNITDAGGNFTATEVEGALAELAAGSTDDQALSLAGNTLTLEDGGTVDLSGYLDDTDTDDQTLSLSGNTLSIADGNSVDLSGYVSTDDQALSLAGNTLTLEDGGTVDLSGYLDDTDTDDQTLSLAGNTLSIADGNSVDLSGYVSTDDQALSLAGNTLTLEDGGTVDLSGYLDDTDTDDQTLSLAGNTLSIADGNSVDLSGYVSTDDQALSLAGNTLTLEDGGTVDLSGYLDDTDTDDQTLSLAGNTLSIADGNSVDLSGYVSTDDQALSLAGNTLTLEDGGTVDLSGYVSTDDQALSLAGNTLTLEDGGTVDLSGYLDDTDTDDQTLSLAGNTLSIADGNSVDLSGYVSTDDQALSLAGNTLTLEDGGTVDLSGYLDDTDTDDQTLSLAGNTLSIADGNSVDLSGYVSTDDQALSLAGNTLTLEDGGTVDLSGYLDDTDTDDQTLSLAGNTLSIADGNSVDLSGYVSTDDQALSLAGNTLTLEDGGTVDLSGYLDDTDTDDQTLSLAGNTLSIADGNSVDLSGYVSTDDQALSLAGNTLTLEDGGTVDLSGYLDDTDTDDQTLSLAGNTLSIADGNSVDLSGYVSTDDQALSLAGNTLTLEDGGTVDLSGYVSTDDQIANEVNITDAGGNFTATEVEGALAELAAGSTDDQTASEVNSDTPVDVDGDGTTEATVEDVIQDIAPIVSKAARIFYPPSIAVDASTIVNNITIDLYQEYIDQFGTPTMASSGAPAAVPTYTKTELYYYVTFADPAVLNIDSIDADGVMQYDVVGTPPDYNSLINVVFVVK